MAHDMPPPSLDDVINSLTKDRLIEIRLEPEELCFTPIFIQETLLCQTSEYFTKALSDRFIEGQQGILRLHGDNPEAWKLLLYWIMTSGHLPVPEIYSGRTVEPEDEVTDLLVRCWVLGEKYGIPRFQDDVMIQLLHLVRNDVQTSYVREAFEGTPPGSKLRSLMAEEVAIRVWGGTSIKAEELDAFDGLTGFTREIFEAKEKLQRDRGSLLVRTDRACGGESWRRYLLHNADDMYNFRRGWWLKDPEERP